MEEWTSKYLNEKDFWTEHVVSIVDEHLSKHVKYSYSQQGNVPFGITAWVNSEGRWGIEWRDQIYLSVIPTI